MATLMYARERASWILNHAGPYGFQRTRGQQLLARIDERQRTDAGVAYNPHVQGIAERLFLRDTKSRAAVLEMVVVIGAALIFPVAWPGGKLLYSWLTRRVEAPEFTLHTIPITALCWIGTVLMWLSALLITPSGTLVGVLLVPWVWVQGAGIFLMAGMYGILEGWLVVPGSTDWYPMPPPPLPSSPSLAKEDTDSPSPTLPNERPQPPLRSPRRPTPRPWE
ncbi:MAG: hypothetical protein AB7G47_20190 [Mycolicibacterium sp.]|uniref:hypothetical protein n=1 Tax=Mycolicibacterium sp. TaxID=2320850 RepID=UPI003D0A6BB2